jgi:hypothetical protein
MQQLYEFADFVRVTRRRLRFGELSRAPLQILRLELRGDTAECDWMTRPADVWDLHLPPPVRDAGRSRQTLVDAMALRTMLLDQLASIRSAVLRGFRASAREVPEPIIFGTITREDPCLLRVASTVMRAKLCGFRFELENGFLKPIKSADESSLPVSDPIPGPDNA